jgi:hypothetical protein
VPRYLVELYRSSAGGDLDVVVARARAAASASRPRGRVRCLRSIFVPAEETWFLLYDAPSRAAVEAALERAALPCERVLEAVTES